MAQPLSPIAPPIELKREMVTPVEANVTPLTPVMPVEQAAPAAEQKPPKEIFELAAATAPGASEGARNRAAQIIKEAGSQQTTKINSNPIWEGVVVSLLRGNLMDAWKFYNGGPEREEEMVDAAGNKVGFKVYNARGATNVYRNREGKEMTEDEVKALSVRGGAITDSDKKALQTAGWASASENIQRARLGLNQPIFAAQQNAYAAASMAGAANKNAEEQIQIARGLRPVLDFMGTLKPEDRQRIFGAINRYNQLSKGAQTGTEQAVGAQSGTLDQRQRSVSGTAGTGVIGGADGQGIAPAGGRVSLGASTGASTMGQQTAGGTSREAATSSTSRNESLQEQQNIETAIMRELQGVIKTPQDFQAFTRYVALDAANQEAYKQMPKEMIPPGYTNIPDVDPRLSGFEGVASNRVAQLRNNALAAAWANEIYKAQRKIAETGESLDMGKLSENFQKSDIFKAINNTYAARLQYELTGKMPEIPKGTLRVNRSNQIIRHGEDK